MHFFVLSQTAPTSAAHLGRQPAATVKTVRTRSYRKPRLPAVERKIIRIFADTDSTDSQRSWSSQLRWMSIKEQKGSQMKRKLPLLTLQTCSSTVATGIGPPEGKNSEGNNANGIMAAADNGQSGIAVTRISCGNDSLFPKENSGRREGNSHCRIWQNERQARDL